MKTLLYNTRDAKGSDFTKEVKIKEYSIEKISFRCEICGKQQETGIPIKKIVSTNFTDWQYVGDYVCEECAGMFSLYPYSHIVDPDGIRLLNIREMAEEIQIPQKPPSKIVIAVSQKKHLFYKAALNYESDNFVVNLEEEQIICNLDELRELFLFVGSFQVLGESKKDLKIGKIKLSTYEKIGYKVYSYLQNRLIQRQIQIPLHLSQKLDISEDEAIRNIKRIIN